MSETNTLELRAYKQSLQMIRSALGLPAESPNDGGDLRKALGQVSALRARVDELETDATDMHSLRANMRDNFPELRALEDREPFNQALMRLIGQMQGKVDDLSAENARLNRWADLIRNAPEGAQEAIRERFLESEALKPITDAWKAKVADLEASLAWLVLAVIADNTIAATSATVSSAFKP